MAGKSAMMTLAKLVVAFDIGAEKGIDTNVQTIYKDTI
jgi:hypothetical protein